MTEEQRKRAEDLSVKWQLAHHPMAIGGDMFADVVHNCNINPAFIAGYEAALNDLIEKEQIPANFAGIAWKINEEKARPYNLKLIDIGSGNTLLLINLDEIPRGFYVADFIDFIQREGIVLKTKGHDAQ